MPVVFQSLTAGWMVVEAVGALEVEGEIFCWKVVQENGAYAVGNLVVVRTDAPDCSPVRGGDGKLWRLVNDEWVVGKLASWPPQWG